MGSRLMSPLSLWERVRVRENRGTINAVKQIPRQLRKTNQTEIGSLTEEAVSELPPDCCSALAAQPFFPTLLSTP